MTPLASPVPEVAAEIVVAAPSPPLGRQRQWSDCPSSAATRERERRLSHARALAVVETLTAVTVLVAILLASNLGKMPDGPAGFLALRISLKNLLLLGLFIVAWPAAFRLVHLYDEMRLRRLRDEALRLFAAGSLGTAFTLLFSLTSVSGAFRFRQVFYFWIGSTMAGLLVRVLWRAFWEQRRQRAIRRVIIVGAGRRASEIFDALVGDPEIHYDIVGLVDSHASRVIGRRLELPVLGALGELEDILMRQQIDEVFIALPVRSHYRDIEEAIRICERAGVHAKYRADIFEPSLARPDYHDWEGSPLVAMHVAPHDYRLWVKRGLDVVGASVLIVLLAPLLLLTAVAIKLTSPGPVIFSQERYGYNKRRFRMLKFRTMVTDAEQLQASLEHRNQADGPTFKIVDDPRVTRPGRLLRRTSIDELPQLFNVLQGHMSLVGPRPLPIRDVTRFTRATDMRRFSVQPGLTCLWQVSGRSTLGFNEWIEMDLKYIDGWSLGLDLLILAKTVPAVLRGTGAN
jgi:exopolysaccharide biosynthesis polyprenyl glycosylphosphotransferase